MPDIPAWAWIVAVLGLGSVVLGGIVQPSYAQDVLLQLGTAALLLVPILLAERSIGRRLSRQIDDRDAIRRAEAALELDDTWRDFGQKIGGRIEPRPLGELERVLSDLGWTRYRTLDNYRLWTNGMERVALPDTPGSPVAAPYVRSLLRTLDLSSDEYEKRVSQDKHSGPL